MAESVKSYIKNGDRGVLDSRIVRMKAVLTALCFAAASFTAVLAQASVNGAVDPLADKCAKKHGTTTDEMSRMFLDLIRGIPTTVQAKCGFTCYLKESGVITSDNKLNVTNAALWWKNLPNGPEKATLLHRACYDRETANDKDECSIGPVTARCYVESSVKVRAVWPPSGLQYCMSRHNTKLEDVTGLVLKQKLPDSNHMRCTVDCYLAQFPIASNGLYYPELFLNGFILTEKLRPKAIKIMKACWQTPGSTIEVQCPMAPVFLNCFYKIQNEIMKPNHEVNVFFPFLNPA